MDYKVQSISPDRIDSADHTFKITTHTETTDLALSISAVGLLQPPIIADAANRLVVVSGFRRLAALISIGWNHIPVRIIEPVPSADHLAAVAIADNAFQRQLNIVETSRGYALIQRYCSSAADWRAVARSSGLPGSETAMKRILPVARMPVDLQHAILEGSIALPVALQINRISEIDRDALVTFFRRLNTGLNLQRELFELISDISHRDSLPITSVLQSIAPTAILADENIPTPQKVQQLRDVIRSMRYPHLRQVEKRYHNQVKSLHLDPKVQLQAPRFFEGKSYRLTLSVESRRQLKQLQAEIEKIISHPELLPE